MGRGSNSKAKLLALWGILYLSQVWEVEEVLIVGDSQVIVGWANGVSHFHSLILEHWKLRVSRLISSFKSISF